MHILSKNITKYAINTQKINKNIRERYRWKKNGAIFIVNYIILPFFMKRVAFNNPTVFTPFTKSTNIMAFQVSK